MNPYCSKCGSFAITVPADCRDASFPRTLEPVSPPTDGLVERLLASSRLRAGAWEMCAEAAEAITRLGADNAGLRVVLQGAQDTLHYIYETSSDEHDSRKAKEALDKIAALQSRA